MMNLGPCDDFVALQAAQQAEALSRQAEGEALYSADAPPICPPWPVRPAVAQ